MSNTQIKPEPQGLISRKLWLQTRQVDIEQAIVRWDLSAKAIPEAWREELKALKLEIEAAK